MMTHITPNWTVSPKVKALITTKTGWDQLFSLDQATDAFFQQRFSLPAPPHWITQKHTTTIVEALPHERFAVADGSFTTQPNVVCAILTADCLPILLCNRHESIVAAIHAGWRGLAQGIIQKSLSKLPKQEQWQVWLGPAIGPSHFEVGEDVFHAFTDTMPTLKSAFHPSGQQKWLADLYTIARLIFKSCGINHCVGGNYCTYRDEHLFYSYRRDGAHTGRMSTLIWLHE